MRYQIGQSLLILFSKRSAAVEVIGNIVMTGYNRRTYRVDDIKWDLSPKSTFTTSQPQVLGKDTSGVQKEISYMDYYKTRYDQKILIEDQPLLVSLPNKKDYHRGNAGPIYLIPELCQMTGLTDAMRGDAKLMQEVSSHLHMPPVSRLATVTNFMKRLQGTPEVRNYTNTAHVQP